MADGRGKASSKGKNTPSKGTPADKRLRGRGRKPGPKPGAKRAKS